MVFVFKPFFHKEYSRQPVLQAPLSNIQLWFFKGISCSKVGDECLEELWAGPLKYNPRKRMGKRMRIIF